MNIRGKLLIITLGCSLLPLLLLSGVISWHTLTGSQEALEQRTKSQLIAVRELKKQQVESYYQRLSNQILTHAQDPTSSFAMQSFTSGVEAFVEQSYAETDKDKAAVDTLYKESYQPIFTQRQQAFDPMAIISALSETSVSLQAKFIANNKHPLGEKRLMVDGGDSSGYTSAHYEYHEVFKKYADTYGLYDIFLINPETGVVVYTVNKNMEFGTSLKTGPFKDSGLAQAYTAALALGEQGGGVYTSDVSPYLPSYNAPAAFMAAPMMPDGDYINGILVYQVPMTDINNLMTSNQSWTAIGLGNTGETYLVGGDLLVRSDTREYIQSPDNFRAISERLGNQDKLEEIFASNTTVGLQKTSSTLIEKALAGETGVGITNNYLNKKVITAYTPIQIGDYQWVLISEINADEATKDADTLQTTVIQQVSVIVIAVALLVLFVVYKSSSLIVDPLKKIIENLAALAAGKGDLTQRLDGEERTDEIGDVSRGFNSFISFMQSLLSKVKDSSHNLNDGCEDLEELSESTNEALQRQRQLSSNVAKQVEQYNESINQLLSDIQDASNQSTVAEQHTKESNSISSEVSLNTHSMLESTNNTASQLKALTVEVNSVASVLEVINSIAEQTNLLALNAAIEAARAGESGRGFAVVADEVRTLAAKTQLSTVEIQKKLESLQAVVKSAVSSMNLAQEKAETNTNKVSLLSDSIEKTTAIISDISMLSNNIASSAQTQQSSISAINTDIKNIDSLSDKNFDRSNEANQSIEHLRTLSKALDGVVSQFKI